MALVYNLHTATKVIGGVVVVVSSTELMNYLTTMPWPFVLSVSPNASCGPDRKKLPASLSPIKDHCKVRCRLGLVRCLEWKPCRA